MSISFPQPLFPIFPVALIAMLLLSALVWLEIKRKQRFLTVRIVAICLSVLAITNLILRPFYILKKSSDIIILTPGYDETLLDSIQKAIPAHQLYAIHVSDNKDAAVIDNYRELGKLKGNLHFIGEGIPEYMQEYVDTSSITTYTPPLPEGFVTYNQANIFTVNHVSQIQGIFNSHHKTSTLRLLSPGGVEDSVTTMDKNQYAFSLGFTPKNRGLYLYTLTASDSSGKIIFTEKIPVQAEDEKQLSILFLCDYPSSEIRFLKNFLEEKDHKLTLRYRISKDRYRTEFVNTNQKSLGSISWDKLQNFDLVITDASSLGSFSDNELHELKNAVKLGLGVLTVLDIPVPSAKTTKFLELKLSTIKSDSATVIIQNKKLKIPATPVTVSSERKLFDVLNEPSGRSISTFYQYQKGKLGFQLLSNTYGLQLSGEKETYAELWSPLLEQVARKETKKYDLIFTSQAPYYQDEPIRFEIIAVGEKPIIRIDSVEIPLTEDQSIKDVWHGRTWAGEPGWHEAVIDQDSSRHSFYISSDGEWKNLRISSQQASLQKIAASRRKTIEQEVYKEVDPIIFFILFILSAGLLWLVPKL